MPAPDCDIVGGSVVVKPKNGAKRTAVELYESAFAFQQRQRIEESHWGVTANLFVRRNVIDAVGPFSNELISGGDAEWCRRAHAAGHRIVFAERARVDHPERGSLVELLSKARRVPVARPQRSGARRSGTCFVALCDQPTEALARRC